MQTARSTELKQGMVREIWCDLPSECSSVGFPIIRGPGVSLIVFTHELCCAGEILARHWRRFWLRRRVDFTYNGCVTPLGLSTVAALVPTVQRYLDSRGGVLVENTKVWDPLPAAPISADLRIYVTYIRTPLGQTIKSKPSTFSTPPHPTHLTPVLSTLNVRVSSENTILTSSDIPCRDLCRRRRIQRE